MVSVSKQSELSFARKQHSIGSNDSHGSHIDEQKEEEKKDKLVDEVLPGHVLVTKDMFYSNSSAEKLDQKRVVSCLDSKINKKRASEPKSKSKGTKRSVSKKSIGKESLGKLSEFFSKKS